MKKILLLSLLAACLACQDDFDELKDSSQRQITFTLDTSDFFDHVLVASNGGYRLGAAASIDADYRLRLTGYCYDRSDSLVQRQSLLASQLGKQSVSFAHLLNSETYHFVFVADVVRHDPYVDYYEKWYQMSTQHWADFYIYTSDDSDVPAYNAASLATVDASPDNQTLDVALRPITYNGYCVLTNYEGIDRLAGNVWAVMSFRLRTLGWQRRTAAHPFDYVYPKETALTIPAAFCYADSVVNVKLKTYTVAGVDSVVFDLPNESRRPFVAVFDCQKLELTDCKYY